MHFYEVYSDDGWKQLLSRDEPIPDWIGCVEQVMSEMPPDKLGARHYLANVVDELCKRLGMKRVVGQAANVGDIRDALIEARRRE